MKLIDANDLKDWSEIVPLTDDGGIDINDFEEKLESMPTVEAIPVEWIKKFAEESKRHIQGSVNNYTYMYDYMLSEWKQRKEE